MEEKLFDLTTVSTPLNNVWGGVVEFIPKLIVAVIIFLIGWIIGAVLARVVAQIIRGIKLDNLLKGIGADVALAKGGFNLDSGEFFGALVKWFFIIALGLLPALNVLDLTQVNDFLQVVVLSYLPRVFVAALILVVGALLAHSIHKLVTGSAKAADIPSAHFMGGVAKWAIWIFTILAALSQLGIAGAFAQTLFTGLVAMLALALGLAFGLGGKDAASQYLAKLRTDINEK